ncbi:SdpI family protein [Calderihabitans maritimus]|uniref:Putative integral membrane protein n=1 Tax=Calderihabitans maritimus TaxID=1246530 RepID=A0A1Z5HQJ9_9FIRM|nr:SdpI family protein [Calderihabitans maritimus]GAW91806.1 putative integral membrane protein [Calderihabitans maritimus]
MNDFPVRHHWPSVVLIIFAFLLGLALYPQLPDLVPSHWNWKGQVDGYMSKTFTIVLFPLLMLGTYLLMTYLPAVDPGKANYPKFRRFYEMFRFILVLFFMVIYFLVLAAGMGYNPAISLWVPLMISLMFIVTGNYLSKVRHNYFFGIRTPWTLADETVWRKTHRAAGMAFVLAGIIGLLSLLLPGIFKMLVFLGALVAAVLYSIIYSYLVYRGLYE